MAENENTEGLLSKALNAVESYLDERLEKSKKPSTDDGVNVAEYEPDSESTLYRKSAYRDGSYSVGAVGYQEKTVRLSFQLLREMSKRDTVVSAIIQNYQNDISDFAKPAKARYEKGFKIIPKNERQKIREIIEELFPEKTAVDGESDEENQGEVDEKKKPKEFGQEKPEQEVSEQPEGEPESEEPEDKKFGKAGEFPPKKKPEESEEDSENPDQELDPKMQEGEEGLDKPAFGEKEPELDENGEEIQPIEELEEEAAFESDEDQLLVEAVEKENINQREKERIAREILFNRSVDEVERIKQLLMTCGELQDRSFEDRRWNFEGFLRAIIRDSLTYDQYGIERVYDKSGSKLHHWVPVDGGTIRFATPALKQQKGQVANEFAYDILFPEQELKALEANDAIVMDEQKLEHDEYKWVQVIRGKIERAFTEKELCVGMRNPTTDIYANGYSIPELELLMNTISSHIFTENYNRLYFTQGFSAKGILHIKAALPRRKLEAFRIQWNHLLKGNKNTFQTPIVSGMEEIQWVPLTQNHSDMEFSNWMNYLIKVICSIYQIDPVEIGFGMKEEGGRGGSLGGDNTREKIQLSREKGLKPLLTHLQTFLNQHIVSQINPEFELVFVGLDDESQKEAIARQEKEVKFKKTVNEIRAEDDLPPLDGADKIILDPQYMAWYQNMSPDAKANMEENNAIYGMTDPNNPPPDPSAFGGDEEGGEEGDEKDPKAKGKSSFPPKSKGKPESKEPVKKSLVSIENYVISED